MSGENIDEYKSNEDQTNDDMAESLIPDMDSIAAKRKGQQSDITIEVCNPVTREEKFSKYTVYTVKGVDKEGNFEVVRRYSDFDKIRTLLVIRWPGCYVPPLPPKTKTGNMQNTFVQERRRLLNSFCQKVAGIPHLHYSEEYQIFIRSANSDLEKTFAPMSKFTNEDLITKYSNSFSHLAGKDTGNDLAFKIAAFKVFLQKTQTHFENCKKVAKSVAQARRAFYDQFSQFHNQVCVEYEKNVFSEYHGRKEGKNVFSDSSSPALVEKADKIKQASTTPSLEYLYEWLKAESSEIEGFLEAIGQREKYEALRNKTIEKQKSDNNELSKVQSGKTTMKSFFSRKTKGEEISVLEKQVEQATKDIESLKTINEMITLIIGSDEIEKFKTNKLEQYYYVVRLAALAELNNTNNVLGYWNVVAENQNIKA